jgi:hypothetical protein
MMIKHLQRRENFRSFAPRYECSANCGKIMDHINLVLKFRLAGNGELQIKGVARIKLDGRGGLIFYEVHSGETQRIAVGQLDSLSVLSMPPAIRTTPSWRTAAIN